MPEYHEPLLTDSRSYVSKDGDILPLELMVDPVQPRPDRTEYPMVRVPDSELEGPTIRLIRQSLAEQAIRSGKEELKDETLGVATALRLLHKETGFYARDNDEKNSMQAIVGRSESGFPTLRYLDEVEYRQRKAKTDDPIRALRSIARHFEDYAVQAHMEVGFSRLFTRTISDRPVNMNQKLSQNISSADISDDVPTRRTLTSIARLREIDLFVEEKGENPLGIHAGIDDLKGEALDNRIFELLDTMQLSGVMKLNERLIDEQNSRFSYWKDRLTEARMRSSIRGQVDQSLEKLNKLRPVILNQK
ncbi:MAG: hypothetical protein JWN12_353 [Candidatus Saccharibacteria bacterium]|nr:hypothetical protein [Candidatus Saccharibacteria bacterium]